MAFVLVILVITLSLYVYSVWVHIFGKHAPFISTRTAVVHRALELLDIRDGSVVYDLGCGDGHVLRSLIVSNPEKKIRGVGIEWSLWPYFLARWKNKRLPISIIRENFFNIRLEDATHIYVFLYPEALAKLEPVILAQCKKGTIIVSCDFMFPTLVPEKVVECTHGKYQLGRKLAVYIV